MTTLKILLVEGNEPERSELVRELEGIGFRVTPVASGADAVESFRNSSFDAMLCDLATPDLDGQTVLANLSTCCANLPVVLLTARESVDKAMTALKSGAQHFLVKPVTTEELEVNIKDAIERIRLEAELTRHQTELESVVRERTAKLEHAIGQLAAINEVTHHLLRIESEEGLLDSVPKLLTRALDFDRAILWMYRGGELQIRSMSFEKDPPEIVADFHQIVTGRQIEFPPQMIRALEKMETVYIPDIQADPDWPSEPAEVVKAKSILITPVVCQGRSVGLISVNMQLHERPMDAQDIGRVETFSAMVGLRLDNLRAHHSLEEKVQERTESLREANDELKKKARQLEDSALQIGRANVELLTTQEELEEKQQEMEALLARLSASRDELRAVLNASTEVVLMANLEGVITIANRGVRNWFDLEIKEVVGRPLHELVHLVADRFEEPERFIKYVLEQPDQAGIPWDSWGSMADLYSNALRTKNPKGKDLLIGWMPVVDDNSQERGRVWYMTDVTALRREDEQLRVIVDASPIPTLVTRFSDGQVIYANNHLTRLFGYRPEDLTGFKAPDFYARPDGRDDVLTALTRNGYVENHEVELRRYDGSSFWALLSLATTRLGGDDVIIGGVLDITERKEAERKLELYRQIFENSRDGILVFGPDRSLVTRNPAHAHMCGLSDADVEGKILLDLVPSEERERIAKAIVEQGSFRGEVNWPVACGDTIALDLSVFPINDNAGEIAYIVGMGRDITERRRAEEARRVAMSELAAANEELKSTQTKLIQSEKMASLGLLVAGIAHEINTPVGAIGSMHDTLIRAVVKLKGELTSGCLSSEQLVKVETFLEVIDDANRVIREGTDRVTTIVRRLRSFARLDEAELKEVDIHDGIEDTLTLIHHEIKNRIEVVREYGDLPPVTVYPGRLNQVFLNLLNNARQAIANNGTISITTAQRDGRIAISISDTGKGIAPKDMGRVFDPGFTTKGAGIGTGLGLSICYQIIEDHHGEIKVESEIGRGTTFTILLPTDLKE